MKLLRARIENFRLLKNIELSFSTDKDRNLTVIRAANESGKTTLLTALQWGLFGDEALPDSGKNFRMSPLDLPSSTITVEIEYEIQTNTGVKKYCILRSLTEHVSNGVCTRDSISVKLFHMDPHGANHIDYPESRLREHLPRELREVFFTDGDRALNFIQGKLANQMKRVEEAIRSLLGLGVIEEAINHTRTVNIELNQKIKGAAGNREELLALSDRLNGYQLQRPKLEEKIRKTKEEKLNLEELADEANRKLSEALLNGNREDLERQRQSALKNRQSAERAAIDAARDHANLFKSELLGKHLLAEPFAEAKMVLDGLHKQGRIPNQTIPVLEDRLRQPVCICGESLDVNDLNGNRRRDHIQNLIEESRNSDAIQAKVTSLYYSAQELLSPIQERTWIDEYRRVFNRRQEASERCQEFGADEAEIEAKIAKMPDVDIRQLQITLNRYREQAREKQIEETRVNTQLEILVHTINNIAKKQDQLLQQDEKGMKIKAELDVLHDLQEVLKNALETMKTSVLQQVSERMNTLFLEMIGADPAQNSIIIRATITPDFRIVVLGRFEQALDPSQDLNGASRRALTIAFILALTQVSEVEAPNVIDTPLGMMSGFVKQAVLQIASQQSSQLILFLTHDEIKGCEDILDERAGRVYTLTNPAHYPKILVNDPGVDDIRVLLCDCDHQRDCSVCARRKR